MKKKNPIHTRIWHMQTPQQRCKAVLQHKKQVSANYTRLFFVLANAIIAIIPQMTCSATADHTS
jgi:hypothetical protein